MVVVDTSVAFKWFDESEAKRDLAKAILVNHIKKKELIVVPELFLYEITNAWSTKTSFTSSEVKENLSYLNKYALKMYSANFPFIIKASLFSKQYQVSVYDASYAVLAEEKKCSLITSDEKFVKQVNLPYVKLLE